MKNRYVAIMAGGIGSRFWPQSRKNYPKQFLDVLGTGETLIQTTYKRFQKLVPEEHIFIVTGTDYVDLMHEQLPSITAPQILAEPARRNTAPCIAYMAFKLATLDPDATFVVAPSDHLITEQAAFIEVLENALAYAYRSDTMITLGIKPHKPHTGYGYIQYDVDVQGNKENIFKVKTFTEKPSLDMAKTFVESGEFLWNSGIFVWHVQTIMDAFKKFQPEIYEIFAEGKDFYNTPEEADFVKQAYAQCRSISIDYAIMEYAKNVCVIPSNFGWSDLGTWTSLWEKHPKDYLGNAIEGKKVMVYDAENCMILAPDDKMVIIQGLDNYCVIDTNDVLLICKLDQEQRIKDFNTEARRLYGEDYS